MQPVPTASLPKPKATLLTPDGSVLATRVHYETLNDAVFLVKAALLASVISVLLFILLSLASANVDIKLGILAIASYPKLLFSASVWSTTSVFAAIQVVWFLAYCLFSHIIHLHFNTTDPPRDWDDRNGEWAVVELDIMANAKPSAGSSSTSSSNNAIQPSSRIQESAGDAPPFSTIPNENCEGKASRFRPVSGAWKLCVAPIAHTNAHAGMPVAVSLLTPDPEYMAFKARRRTQKPPPSTE